MHCKNIVLICWAVLMTAACNTDRKKDAKPAKDPAVTTSNAIKKGLEVEPLIKKTDSLEVLYFNNPDGDSLRYTRFFRYMTTNDSTTIQLLLASLDQPVEQRYEVKQCRSEGKIYTFNKGEPLKTIYFSTRCDSCCYLYYIKDGAFYYTGLSNGLKNELKENKRLTRKP